MTHTTTDDSWVRFRRIARWVLLCLAAWFALAFIVVPAAIYVAHRTGIPVPGDLMAGRATTPISSYLETWRVPADRFSGFFVRAAGYIVALAALAAFATNAGGRESGRLDSSTWPTTFWVVLALCVGGVVSTLVLQYWFPVAYASLVIEDGVGEQASFFCWLSIPILLAHHAPGRKKPAIVLFGVASFVIAMEEIAWGQRLIGLDTPSALGRINYQNELTVHNLEVFRAVFEYQAEFLALIVLVGTFVVPWAMGAFPRFGAISERIGIPRVPRYLWPAAITVVALLMTRIYVWGSEIGDAAVALFAVSVALAIVFESSHRYRAPGARVSIGFVALVILMLGGGLLTQRSDLQSKMIGMATSKYPLEGMYKQPVMLFEYFETRPEYDYDRFGIDYARALSLAGRPDDAQEVLRQHLALLTRDRTVSAEKQRAIGEMLIRLSREADAALALERALEIDRAALARSDRPDRVAVIRWSLAKTHRLLADSAQVEREIEQALLTPSLRDRLQMQLWFDGVGGSRAD
ncbi:MAG: tetratricopeptide repeat protein [Gemmatimonadota bacterium]|nr:tetratricopeptide repeat protein [Gemmatimonadota bacterium]